MNEGWIGKIGQGLQRVGLEWPLDGTEGEMSDR